MILDSLVRSLDCEICGQEIVFDHKATFDDYSVLIKATAENVFDKVDKILNKHLVYTCRHCGQTYKYTYKEIEFNLRRQLTLKALVFIVRENIVSNPAFLTEKFMIYCGKCGGVDGTGCCPKSILDKCEIKRFPTHVF